MQNATVPDTPTTPEPSTAPMPRETAPLYERGHAPWQISSAADASESARRRDRIDRAVWLITMGALTFLMIALVVWLLFLVPGLK